MSEAIICAYGYQGDLYVYDDKIVIKRPSSSNCQRKEIKYEQIKEIKYEESKGGNYGYVCFELKDYQGDLIDNTLQFANPQKPKIVEALHIIQAKFQEITNETLFIGNNYKYIPLEQAVKVEKTKETINSWIIAIVVILVGLWIFNSIFSHKTSDKDTTTKNIDINASVTFTGTQFTITNNDDFDWTDCKLEVNSGFVKSGYVLYAGVIKAGTTYTVGTLQFAKNDGTRFNPFLVKPQNMSISCNTEKGHAFYYGGWK